MVKNQKNNKKYTKIRKKTKKIAICINKCFEEHKKMVNLARLIKMKEVVKINILLKLEKRKNIKTLLKYLLKLI